MKREIHWTGELSPYAAAPAVTVKGFGESASIEAGFSVRSDNEIFLEDAPRFKVYAPEGYEIPGRVFVARDMAQCALSGGHFIYGAIDVTPGIAGATLALFSGKTQYLTYARIFSGARMVTSSSRFSRPWTDIGDGYALANFVFSRGQPTRSAIVRADRLEPVWQRCVEISAFAVQKRDVLSFARSIHEIAAAVDQIDALLAGIVAE